MTREEKQKALAVLKISAPVMAVTQEAFTDYTQTLNKIMDWLEQTPCDGAISKQAVLKMAYDMSEIDGEHFTEPYMVVDVEDIQKLPPVNPQPKTGHWIKIKPYPLQMHDYECSECLHETDDPTENYCSECGAKMIEPRESEGV